MTKPFCLLFNPKAAPEGEAKGTGPNFIQERGTLCRVLQVGSMEETKRHLVAPFPVRSLIVHLSHDILLAEHLPVGKMWNCITPGRREYIK